MNHYVPDSQRTHPYGKVNKFHGTFAQLLAEIRRLGPLPSKGAGYDENNPDAGPVKLPCIYSCESRTTPFWSYSTQGQLKDPQGRRHTLDAHEFVIPLQNDLQAAKGIPPVEKGFKVLCGLVPEKTTPEYRPGCWARYQVCNYKGPQARKLKVQYAFPKPEVKIGWLEWICTSGRSCSISDLWTPEALADFQGTKGGRKLIRELERMDEIAQSCIVGADWFANNDRHDVTLSEQVPRVLRSPQRHERTNFERTKRPSSTLRKKLKKIKLAEQGPASADTVSYTHLRAHET